MDLIDGVVLVAVFCAICWRSLGTWCGSRWLTKLPASHAGEHRTPFVILLPVLREQGLVDQTLQHFAGLDYPTSLFRVVIVATARERREREALSATLVEYANQLYGASATARASEFLSGHLPEAAVTRLLDERKSMTLAEFTSLVTSEFIHLATTLDHVREKLVDHGPLVTVVEAPEEWELKAGQVQFAIDHLDEILGGWTALPNCKYVAVYDFDGRPMKDTLRRASEAAATGAPLLQQPGLTIPIGIGRSVFATLDGQLHARLALRLELWLRLVDQVVHRVDKGVHPVLMAAVHTVGNGLFIDRTQLAGLGGIPSPVDDLALGWRAADIGQPVALIRAVTYYDAYRHRQEASRSRAFICRGYLLALRDPLRLPGSGWLARYLHRARVGARLVQWTYGPVLRLLLLALLAWALPLWAGVVLVVSYVAFLFDIWTVRRLWSNIPPDAVEISSPVWSWLVSPLALVWYGEGARRALRDGRGGDVITTTAKTER